MPAETGMFQREVGLLKNGKLRVGGISLLQPVRYWAAMAWSHENPRLVPSERCRRSGAGVRSGFHREPCRELYPHGQRGRHVLVHEFVHAWSELPPLRQRSAVG